MKTTPTYGSGPVVWAGIIATTCLLLFFFQKMLWLVVPFLLALILYYLMYPVLHRFARALTRAAQRLLFRCP